jgi:hypothetical protein
MRSRCATGFLSRTHLFVNIQNTANNGGPDGRYFWMITQENNSFAGWADLRPYKISVDWIGQLNHKTASCTCAAIAFVDCARRRLTHLMVAVA